MIDQAIKYGMPPALRRTMDVAQFVVVYGLNAAVAAPFFMLLFAPCYIDKL